MVQGQPCEFIQSFTLDPNHPSTLPDHRSNPIIMIDAADGSGEHGDGLLTARLSPRSARAYCPPKPVGQMTLTRPAINPAPRASAHPLLLRDYNERGRCR